MQFEEQGRRKAAVKLGLQAITKIHAMLSREADDVPSAVKKSGIKRVQFMNRPVKRDLFKVTNIKDAKQIEELIDNHKFGGGSPIGDGLRDNILNPLVFKRKSPFTKPLLVMIITDGGVGNQHVLLKNADGVG